MRRTVVGGWLATVCPPPTVERDRRQWRGLWRRCRNARRKGQIPLRRLPRVLSRGCYEDVTGLSRTCHGEVGVMECGLNSASAQYWRLRSIPSRPIFILFSVCSCSHCSFSVLFCESTHFVSCLVSCYLVVSLSVAVDRETPTRTVFISSPTKLHNNCHA